MRENWEENPARSHRNMDKRLEEREINMSSKLSSCMDIRYTRNVAGGKVTIIPNRVPFEF